MSLRWRLTLLYSGLSGLLLAMAFIVTYIGVRNTLSSSFEKELENIHNQAKVILSGSKNGTPTAEDWRVFAREAYGEIIQYYAPRFVAKDFIEQTRISFGNDNLYVLGAQIMVSDAAWETLERTGHFRGSGWLSSTKEALEVRISLSEPLLINGVAIVPVVLVAKSFAETKGVLETLQRALVVVALVGIVAAGFASYFAARSALSPITAVRDAAAAIGGRNLNLRVPEQGTKDEVDDLAKTLNAMLERLESSFETQRRFTADASHELRTPVTAIGGHASYLMRRTNPTEAQKESLEAISSLSVRLGRLIGDLLDLARADAGFGIEQVQTNLMSLAEDVHLEVVAIAGNCEIELRGDSSLKAVIDPNRVRQVIRNLVQNALKAGSSQIVVEIAKSDRFAKISVQDNGSGISAEHLDKLFDRFYRVDTSRDRAAGGSGLGLSIVKWIVEAHGGSIHVSSELNVGTRFEVYLPLSAVLKNATGSLV
ncbi:MAG: sensor histidine kinase [Deinococcales bacterium]